MSKAFTRESDDTPDRPMPVRNTPILPPGTKNYITPAGAAKLRQELEQLASEIHAAADKRTASQEQRLRQIEESLRTAEMVEQPPKPWDTVRFGAKVTLRTRAGEHATYRIVGVDEADIDRDWISWISPLARALLKRKLGEQLRISLPGGMQEFEIIGIDYE